MDGRSAASESGIPPELVSAVNRLRSEFNMGHLENGNEIANRCFYVLHPQPARSGNKSL